MSGMLFRTIMICTSYVQDMIQHEVLRTCSPMEAKLSPTLCTLCTEMYYSDVTFSDSILSLLGLHNLTNASYYISLINETTFKKWTDG